MANYEITKVNLHIVQKENLSKIQKISINNSGKDPLLCVFSQFLLAMALRLKTRRERSQSAWEGHW